MAESIQLARSLDIDGIVITSASGGSDFAITESAALQRKTAEARKLIGSKWWESFSRLVEPVVSSQRNATRSAEETGSCVEQNSHANEESVRVV
jgi:hypothetical protein